MPLRSLLAICLCLLMMLGLIFFHYTQSGIDALTVLSSLLILCVTAAFGIGSYRVRRRKADVTSRSKAFRGGGKENDPTVWPPPPKDPRRGGQ